VVVVIADMLLWLAERVTAGAVIAGAVVAMLVEDAIQPPGKLADQKVTAAVGPATHPK